MRRPKPPTMTAFLTAMALLAPGAAHADCAPPAEGPPMCLVGTITSPGYTAAFVELAGAPGLETVTADGQLLDWRVLKITPRAVLLGQKEQQVSLVLGDPDWAATPGEAPVAQATSESIAAHSLRLRLRRKQLRQK